MSNQSYVVFFKVESENHSVDEMRSFGQNCIKQSKFCFIQKTSSNQREVTFVVQFKYFDDAERFIHDNVYKQYKNGIKTLAFWNGKKPRFEVFVSCGPKGITRRDLFLAMEQFGAIGKATVKKSCEGSGWVSFLDQISYKNALNTPVYIGNMKLKVSLNDGSIDNIPKPIEKKNIKFDALLL